MEKDINISGKLAFFIFLIAIFMGIKSSIRYNECKKLINEIHRIQNNTR